MFRNNKQKVQEQALLQLSCLIQPAQPLVALYLTQLRFPQEVGVVADGFLILRVEDIGSEDGSALLATLIAELFVDRFVLPFP